MKRFNIVCVLLVLSQCYASNLIMENSLPERGFNTQGLTGIFDQNKLGKPVQIPDCFDDQSHKQIFEFLGPFIHKVALTGVTGYFQLYNELTQFSDSLPEDQRLCAESSQEYFQLLAAYGQDESMDKGKLITQLIKYASFHQKTINSWKNQDDQSWNKDKDYYGTGHSAAEQLHIMLNQ